MACVVYADDDLEYRWRLIEHPKDFKGTQSGFETPSMKLGKLTEGNYQFKVRWWSLDSAIFV